MADPADLSSADRHALGIAGEERAAAHLAARGYRILARNDGAFGIHELYGMPRTAGVSFQYQWE